MRKILIALAATAAFLPSVAAAKIDPKMAICTAYGTNESPDVRVIAEAPGDNNSGIAGVVNCTSYVVKDIRDVSKESLRIAYVFKKRAIKTSTQYDWDADGQLNFNPRETRFNVGLDHWWYKKTDAGDAWPGTCEHFLSITLRASDGTEKIVTPTQPFNVCKSNILALVAVKAVASTN